MFFVNGAVLATWVPLIPAVQQRLALTSGQLGVALLGVAVGAVIAFGLALRPEASSPQAPPAPGMRRSEELDARDRELALQTRPGG